MTCLNVSSQISSSLPMTACYMGRSSITQTVSKSSKISTISRSGNASGIWPSMPTSVKFFASLMRDGPSVLTTTSIVRSLPRSQELATKTDAKYLVVTISNKLSWSKHTDNSTKKANSMMAFLRRNIRSATQAAKETAYKTLSNQRCNMPVRLGHLTLKLTLENWNWFSKEQCDSSSTTSSAQVVSQR